MVCIKRVPDTQEVDLRIDASEKDIIKDRLSWTINESDNYALEEALLIKGRIGGTVTLITLGPKEADEVLRMGLAKGADNAIRLWDERFLGSDGYTTAKILSSAIKKINYNIILTGSIATDDGYSQIGPTIAALLNLPYATFITKLELKDNFALVKRELEGGLLEVKEVQLPALFTIQTGINTPRYASILGIKKASAKEIKVWNLEELGLSSEEVGELGSKTILNKIYIPVVESKAEILSGEPDEISAKFVTILKEKGLL